MSEAKTARISFFSKNETECPVCGTKFFREDILTGRGRLIAGELTDELRRLYEPSQKYGVVYPLIYAITVCPGCYYAAYPADFLELQSSGIAQLEADTDERIRGVQQLFEELDYREPRDLEEGAASFYLALRSYDAFQKEVSPTIKQGLSAIRAGWLFSDLHRRAPEENYDYISRLFYRKARFFYIEAIEYEQNGKESIAIGGSLGPDIDQNYGFDGVLYIAAYLEFFFGPTGIPEKRKKALERAKTQTARLFGMGKASKQKPSVILDKARDLYDEIRDVLEADFDGTDESTDDGAEGEPRSVPDDLREDASDDGPDGAPDDEPDEEFSIPDDDAFDADTDFDFEDE